MHNHNNHDSKMMWLMALCCALPFVILLIAGGRGGGNGWPLLLGIGVVFVVGHFWLMRKGSNTAFPRNEEKTSSEKEHKHNEHSCH